MFSKICSSLRVFVAAVLVGITFIPGSIQALTLIEDFSNSPFVEDGGRFSIVGPGIDQFFYQVDEPAFTGDPAGSLVVHYDSARPTTRFRAPLGITVSDEDSFSFGSIMTIQSDDYFPSPFGFMEIAFGLTNSETTGEDRTGSSEDFAADTFDMVEFDYFPNISDLFGGPWVVPAVFGPDVTGDAFGNFVSTSGGFFLPLDTPLFIQVDYDGAATTMTIKISEISVDGSVTELVTGISPLNVFDTGNPWLPGIIGGFSVDTISISAYEDGWNSSFLPISLVATVIYDKLFFVKEEQEIAASVDIDPDTLNLKSQGKWITAYLTLPSDYKVEDVKIDTVRLQDALKVKLGEIQDGTLMLKFSRSEMQSILPVGEADITVTGELTDGTIFKATDTISVISDRR